VLIFLEVEDLTSVGYTSECVLIYKQKKVLFLCKWLSNVKEESDILFIIRHFE
jgi:hypothetical protein